MTAKIPAVDDYLVQGCGRCPLFATPDCKVNTWRNELALLRELVLAAGLTEERKWGVPTYTFNGVNVIQISAFVDNCVISFFKGILLKDRDGVLQKLGENTYADRVLRFTSIDEVEAMTPVINALIAETIAVEKAGLQVDYSQRPALDYPSELQTKFDQDPVLQRAFEALTPGRQRGYLLHFSAAKQPATRIRRIEKYTPRIMEGLGMHDRD